MRELIGTYGRRLAPLIAALALSGPSHGAPAVGAETKKQAAQEVSWLSRSDYELVRRSYVRCLRERYTRIGYAQHDAALVRAFHRDLDQLTLLISPEDVKRAPRVLVSRVPHIGCEWFNEGSATAP